MNDQTDMYVARIERAVLQATHGRVAKLRIYQCGDEVVLHGRCPTLGCRKLAQDAAIPLIGVAKLTNRIEIA